MEGSVETQTLVSPTKEVMPEPVTETEQQNGVEDVVSTNGSGDVPIDENLDEESLTGKKRKSLEGVDEQESECKRLKTVHPEESEEASEEPSEEIVEEKKSEEEAKGEQQTTEAEEKTEDNKVEDTSENQVETEEAQEAETC